MSTESGFGLPVEIEDLCFSYEAANPVLNGINLTINPGERFGIIGPSGAGKSTLLLHLNGILSGQGRVSIGGIPVEKRNLDRIRQRVGLVFQNPDDQLFNPTVEEDVAFGPLNMGLGAADVEARVRDALARMDLGGFEEKSSHHLSFGERKRVALATVLSMSPGVVAFDEPFSNLDPHMVEQVIETIRELSATVIVVSQSILPLFAFCDRLAVLKSGRIQAVGDVPSIAADRALLGSCGLDYRIYCDLCRKLKI